jgi:hypothetical protein
VRRFPDGGLISIGGTGDVGADGPATCIFLHKSLNYISIDRPIILCKFKNRLTETQPWLKSSPLKMTRIA